MPVKITCFIIAYLVIRLGANLLREGVNGEFKFQTSMSGMKGDLASASPGLLFLVVGGILIGVAMSVDKPAEDEKSLSSAGVTSPPRTALPSDEELANGQ